MDPILLLGSQAWAARRPITHREYGRDTDIIGAYDDVIAYIKSFGPVKSIVPADKGKKVIAKLANGHIIEAEIAWPDSLAMDLWRYCYHDPETIKNGHIMIPSLDVLYTLKMSHRFLKNSPHFLKTMDDIRVLRSILAMPWQPVIPNGLMEWYGMREKATYNYGHPKLNVTKKEFFNGDGVEYKYDHDSIHQSVKRMDWPAYQNFKDDQAEVYCSKEKFWACHESVRLNAVLEESMVLALERSQVPFPGLWTPKKSFDVALEKVCTSITSGWFREYAWENYYKVQSLYDDNYVDKFWEDVNSGIVKPYRKEENVAV